MSTVTEKYCPRCKQSFSCNAAAISNCSCSTVTLLPETLSFLQKTLYGCLCNNCLEEINALVAYSLEHPFPDSALLQQEGVHYYLENGFLVFTELYHLQRGYCCRSGCRHCAYGYKR